MARLDDIDPSLGVERPRVDVAATGPKTIETAARLADGISFSVGADIGRLTNAIRSRAGRLQGGRQGPGNAGVRLLRPGGANRRVRRQRAGGDTRAGCDSRAVLGLRGEADRGRSRRTSTIEYRNAVTVMEDIYHAERGGVTRTPGGEPGEIDFYPREAGADDLIDQFGIAGPAEYCAARLREIMALGVARIYIGTRAVGVDLAERNADRIGREVLPLLR